VAKERTAGAGTDDKTLMPNGGKILYPVLREQIIELAVFLFLITPSMIFSFFAIKQGSIGFALMSVATILRDLALLCLVLFFIWRNGEPLMAVGLTARNFWREAALGAVLFIPLFLATSAIEVFFEKAGLSTPSVPLPLFTEEKGAVEFVLAFLLVAVVALCEESIFRGYMILRFRNITSSAPAAVLLSSLIFSLGHGYEGTAGVATVGVMGIVFALVYLWRKNLAAPIVMHFLNDFIVIVMLPLVKHTKHFL
jgi:membrane protease YdiL (CAAX protease family)